MLKGGRVYRLTETGRKAWETQDRAIPAEYRRILWLLEAEAHTDVVRGALRRYPDHLLEEWLAELEEAGLLASSQAVEEYDLDFTVITTRLPRLSEEDREQLERDSHAAGAVLADSGVWLAEERIRNRPPLGKPAEETSVLIVEDDPDQLALADLRLSMAGYKVRVAEGRSALLHELFEHGNPDLLLLDVMLPDGNGFDILAKMRRHPVYALLPVLMLTVRNRPADIRKGLALGADGYITKPYSKKKLADAIGRVLGV